MEIKLDGTRYFERKSFAEQGNDVLMEIFLERLFKRSHPFSYVDIGSNHPIWCNNTYFAYIRGGNGVLIEPNPIFAESTKFMRQKDAFYNVAIKFGDLSEAAYYDFGQVYAGYNTFSEWSAKHTEQYLNIKPQQIVKLQLKEINPILQQHFPGGEFDILSIDCESADPGIVMSVDFKKFRPLILCIEHRDLKLDAFLQDKGYYIVSGLPDSTLYANSQAIKVDYAFKPMAYIDSDRTSSASKNESDEQVIVKDLLKSALQNNATPEAMYSLAMDAVDRDYYLKSYPDVARTGMDPAKHFLLYGYKEGRNPNAWFNTLYYIANNPDVGESNPIIHYITKGIFERRPTRP